MYDNLMNKFKLKNIYTKKAYLDETNQRFVLNYRNLYARLAGALIFEGKKDSARKVLDYCMSIFPDEICHYDYYVPALASCYYKIGDDQKGDKICERVSELMDKDMDYLFSFPLDDLKSLDQTFREDLLVLQHVNEAVKGSKNQTLARNIESAFHKNWDLYNEKVYKH
jgi:hypothetical protein